MRQFILLALISISTFGIAQNNLTNHRTITVYGTVEKPLEDVIYKTEVTLTIEKGYYDEGPYKTLNELLTKYYDEVKGLNIDMSKFVRDDLAFAATGYRKEGTILRYQTDNKEDIIKLTSIKMSQVLPSYIQVKSKMTDEQIKSLTEKALKDARNNAEILAEASGGEIDKIFSIGSYDLGSYTYWRTANSVPEFFRLTVVYTLKD